MRDCKILASEPRFGKQLVVGRAGLRFNNEHKQSRRFAVEPVRRRQIWQSSDSLKPNEQRTLDMFSGRRHGHSMGFVHNQDLVVAVNNQRLFEASRLLRNFFPIENGHPVPIGRIPLQRGAVAQRDQALRNALAPNARVHLREPRKQVLEYGFGSIIESWEIEARRASLHRRGIIDLHSGSIIAVRVTIRA